MNNIIVPSLMQFLTQSPVLLVYFAGVILAFVFWGRCQGPSLLVLIGMVLMLGVAVVQTFATQYIINARVEMGWEPAKMSWMLSALGLTSSLFRALGIGFLLAAVFVGRKPAQQPGSYQGNGQPGRKSVTLL